MGWLGLLTILLALAKIFGLVTFSWFWVVLPLLLLILIPLVLFLITIAIAVFTGLVGALID